MPKNNPKEVNIIENISVKKITIVITESFKSLFTIFLKL